jgi:hypothetical protein
MYLSNTPLHRSAIQDSFFFEDRDDGDSRRHSRGQARYGDLFDRINKILPKQFDEPDVTKRLRLRVARSTKWCRNLSISPHTIRCIHRSNESTVRETGMAGRHKLFESLRSIAGGILVGFGLHFLFGNLNRVAVQLKHLLGISTGEALGTLPSVVLAASQAARAYTLDHKDVLLGLLRMLESFWRLLLVIAGTMLLRDVFTDKVKALPAPNPYLQENIFKNKVTGCRFRCASFDV